MPLRNLLVKTGTIPEEPRGHSFQRRPYLDNDIDYWEVPSPTRALTDCTSF
jgi:hypothetical protein